MQAAATWIAPFIRTPGNILRQGAEFSPFGFAMKAAHQGGREGAQALGRAALGTVTLAPLAWLAATGRLTERGERVLLSRQQQDAADEAIGRERRARLERIVALPAFSTMRADGQRRLIENALRDATTAIRGRVLARVRQRRPFTVTDLLTPAARRVRATQEPRVPVMVGGAR